MSVHSFTMDLEWLDTDRKILMTTPTQTWQDLKFPMGNCEFCKHSLYVNRDTINPENTIMGCTKYGEFCADCEEHKPECWERDTTLIWD